MKNVCKLELRVFNFDLYPSHVRNLKTYAFKVLAIAVSKFYINFIFFNLKMRAKIKRNVKTFFI